MCGTALSNRDRGSSADGDVREAARATSEPDRTVAAIARLLASAGEHLQTGDRILAGSCCDVRVAPGEHVVAEIDALGAMAVTIAP